VIADVAGYRPVKATGLLMVYLQAIIDGRPSDPSIFVALLDKRTWPCRIFSAQ
jgi:hypothetical protein